MAAYKLAGFGNILLDVCVRLADDKLLRKYGLENDGAKELPPTLMKSIRDEINTLGYHVIETAGGAAQNTIRTFQWLSGKTRSTLMIGSIGTDTNGEQLKEFAEQYNMDVCFSDKRGSETGWSLCLINNEHRSLVAHIGAAELFTKSDFLMFQNRLDDIPMIYMEGFFLSNRSEVARTILKHAIRRHKRFAFNLSATYVCIQCKKDIIHFARNCDLLFGNYGEFQTLATILNVTHTPEQLATKLAAEKNQKIVIVTNSSEFVYVAYNQSEFIRYDVPQLNKEKIVDTTGAGDAFVAGFLFSHLNGAPLLANIVCGCKVANIIIGQIGSMPPQNESASHWHHLCD